MRRLGHALLTLSLSSLAILAEEAERARLHRDLSIAVITYGGYIDYGSRAVKRNDRFAGAYAYLGLGMKHSVEAEVDYTRITYRSGFDLEQWDYTLIYSNYSIPNWRIRLGGHYTRDDADFTDDSYTTISGLHYYVINKLDAGLDFYYSRYSDYDPDLSVYQFSPHIGGNFWQNQHLTLRGDLTGHYIYLDEKVGLGERAFHSVEARLSLIGRRWSCGVFGWRGEQALAVRNDGLTVYNLPERHTSGYGGDVKLRLTDHVALTFRTARENFEDFWYRRETHSTKAMVLLGISF